MTKRLLITHEDWFYADTAMAQDEEVDVAALFAQYRTELLEKALEECKYPREDYLTPTERAIQGRVNNHVKRKLTALKDKGL